MHKPNRQQSKGRSLPVCPTAAVRAVQQLLGDALLKPRVCGAQCSATRRLIGRYSRLALLWACRRKQSNPPFRPQSNSNKLDHWSLRSEAAPFISTKKLATSRLLKHPMRHPATGGNGKPRYCTSQKCHLPRHCSFPVSRRSIGSQLPTNDSASAPRTIYMDRVLCKVGTVHNTVDAHSRKGFKLPMNGSARSLPRGTSTSENLTMLCTMVQSTLARVLDLRSATFIRLVAGKDSTSVYIQRFLVYVGACICTQITLHLRCISHSADSSQHRCSSGVSSLP